MMKSGSAAAVAMVAMLLTATPAAADDDKEKIGIAAAFGLTAATGKTTVEEGGAAIEAALLTSDAVREAGRVIAALATRAAGGRDVLVLARAEQVNLMAADTVGRRIDDVRRALGTITRGNGCMKPKTDTQKLLGMLQGALGQKMLAEGGAEAVTESATAAAPKPKLAWADVAAAFATDTSYRPITLSMDDRMLIAAVGMSGQREVLPGKGEWTAVTKLDATNGGGHLIVPSEITVAPTADDSLLGRYVAMMQQADQRRQCDTDEAKGAVDAADKLSAAITTPDEKTGISPLAAARQIEVIRMQGNVPYVLRVAVEQAGGTAITSANIWYTLGLPGAAQVSSGLLASYRLMDPATGVTQSAGFVRCAIAPLNIRNVHLVVNPRAANYFTQKTDRGRAYCSYLATPTTT